MKANPAPTFRPASASCPARVVRPAVAALLLGLLLTSACSFAAEIVSRPHRTAATGSRESLNPQFSDDGETFVFVSLARNLTTNDAASPWLNIYAGTLNTGGSHLELVSAKQPGPGGGNGHASAPALSAAGRWIAFQSEADDLLDGGAVDHNRASDVFLRDRFAGTTSLISVATNGLAGNGASFNPRISADGRYVVFDSAASDLVPDDNNGGPDVFLRDRELGTTRLVSREANPAGFRPGRCEVAAITPDAGQILFVRWLISGLPESHSWSEVYLYNREDGTTRWVSAGVPPPVQAMTTNHCLHPSVSDDGKVVAFLVVDTYLRGQVYRWVADEQPGPATPLLLGPSPGLNAAWTEAPALSRDGRFLAVVGNELAAYSPDQPEPQARSQAVFLYDAVVGTSRRVTNSCGPPMESCRAPALSRDGSRLAFQGVVGDDTNVFVWDGTTGCAVRVIVNTNGLSRPPVPGSAPVLSPDGQGVAFESAASDLCPADYNQATDVFLGRPSLSTVELLSARDVSRPALTGPRSSILSPEAASADGRVVVFASQDDQLAEDDLNPGFDIFASDRATGQITPMSSFQTPPSSGPAYRSHPAISADGRYVAFRENLTNILWLDRLTGTSGRLRHDALGGDESPVPPLLSRDGRFLLVEDYQRIAGGVQVFARYELERFAGVETSIIRTNPLAIRSARFSPDGQRIAFLAKDYAVRIAEESPGFPKTDAGGTELMTVALGSNSYRPISYLPASTNPAVLLAIRMPIAQFSFSGNSRFVFFQHSNSNCCSGGSAQSWTYRHDLAAPITAATVLVCTNGSNPSARADGQEVAIETDRSSGNPPTSDIEVIDLPTGRRTLITVSYDGQTNGNARSYGPLMSHDGRYVAFLSLASNLVPDDANGMEDAYVRDRWTGTTLQITGGIIGLRTDRAPLRLQMSSDGRTILLQSFRNDLDPADFNLQSDIFALHLTSPDSDGDGMEDAWEMAYFDTLGRTGEGDFDGDGVTDGQEYRSGTDPTDRGSVFKVLAVTGAENGETRLLWASTPGRRYQLQVKDRADALPWVDLGPVVTASGATASAKDPGPAGSVERYFRVTLLP